MISFIFAAAMLLDTQTYEASDLTTETIYNIEHSENTEVAPIGMFYIEESETEGLFPIRRPTPAPSNPAPEAPSRGDDYLFPILGRLFWGILGLPFVQLILGFFVVKFILESIYGSAWLAGFVTDVVTQVTGLFQGLMSPFNGGNEDENELGEDEEWEWVDEDE